MQRDCILEVFGLLHGERIGGGQRSRSLQEALRHWVCSCPSPAIYLISSLNLSEPDFRHL